MLGLNSLLHRTLRQRLHVALVEHVLKALGQVRRIPVPRAATACDSTLRSDSHSCCLRRARMFGDTHHTSSPISAAARSSYRWNMWPGTNATHVCLRNIRGRRLYVVVRSTTNRAKARRTLLSDRFLSMPSSPLLRGEQIVQMLVGLDCRRNPLGCAQDGLRVL